jgi:hypothetical protein
VKLGHCQGHGFFPEKTWRLNLRRESRLCRKMRRGMEVSTDQKFSPHELLEATAMLVDIFRESPIFLYPFPNRDKRKQALHALFLASLKHAERFGIVDVIEGERLLSLFIYYPPDRYPMSAARVLRHLPHYLS